MAKKQYVEHLTITISDQGPESGYDPGVGYQARLHDIFVSDDNDDLITCVHPRYSYISPVVKALSIAYRDLGYAVSIVDHRRYGRLTTPTVEDK